MARYIIQCNCVYNLWSTVVDAPLLKPGLTKDQLIEELERRNETHDLDARLARAEATGCSAINPRMTLAEVVSGNRAGPNKSELDLEAIIREYLSLPEEVKPKSVWT